MRKMDFYLKGWKTMERQDFYKLMDKISPDEMYRIVNENLLEKYSEEKRRVLKEKKEYEFKRVNRYLKEHKTCPIFNNPKDIKKSSIKYIDLMQFHKDSKLLEEYFGCSFEEYVPKVYEEEKKQKNEKEK